MHERVTIRTEMGEEAEAIAPVIISASRATDIPAFHREWLMERLKAGHCQWKNPFGGKSQWVSFAKARAIVFWTKNPAPMLGCLDELDAMGINYYFQFTLNDYGSLEPGVPPLGERIETFARLSGRLGPERIIWRFDPLLIMPGTGPRDLLMKVWNLGKRLKGLTRKLVFSFVDIRAYPGVQRRMAARIPGMDRGGALACEPDAGQRTEIAEGLAKIRDRWNSEGWPLELATCGEEADLAACGISRNSCVDGGLLRQLFPDDAALVSWLDGRGAKKDRGQRKACGCIPSKDIGAYGTCGHGCAYCYAGGWKIGAVIPFAEFARKMSASLLVCPWSGHPFRRH